MRILAGLHDAERGDVRLGDTDLAGTAVEGRRIGYVPQSAALLPHLPVHRQVAWGVHSDPQAVAYWLGRLDADSLANRYPDELSGGQRQRVAIARALASGPRLLLLDEPFAGLDTPTRVELRRDVRRLQSEARITTVLVTHDPDDVAMLADDVIVLSQGRVLQRGPVNEVCRRPGSVEVAKLLGIENALDVTVASPGTLATADGVTLLAPGTDLPPGTRAVVTIDPAGAMLGVGTLRGIVLDVVGYPAQQRVEVGLGPRTTVTVVAPDRDGPPRLGMPINVAIPSDAIRVSVLSS
jgi:molybdate transport system permease protein